MLVASRCLAAIVVLVSLSCSGGSSTGDPEPPRNGAPPSNDVPPDTSPIRIGVMSGALQRDGFGADTQALEWAVENVNAAGKINGHRPLELVYMDWAADYDSYGEFLPDPRPAAKRMLADPSIVAVLGPFASTHVMDVGDLFINAKVPLLTNAGSASIVRAFGGKDFIWRTRESDIAQVEAMLADAKAAGARSVAMLAPFGAYGETFFDWFAFLAAESGLEVTGVLRMDMEFADLDPEPFLDVLLGVGDPSAAVPDVLLAVPTNDAMFVSIADYWDAYQVPTDIIYSDGGFWPDIADYAGEFWPSATGEEARGYLEEVLDGSRGVVPASPPETGFAAALELRTGQVAGADFDAALYDAVLLLAYGLEASGGEGGDALVAGMKRAARGNGEGYGWRPDDVASALAAIRAGQTPSFQGASGPLLFDPELYTEPVSSTFGMWRVTGSAYGFASFHETGTARATSGRSAVTTTARDDGDDAPEQGTFQPLDTEVNDLWVMLVALSDGWSNYRHQADALAYYQYFRAQGVPDDQIIMIGANDLGSAERNPLPAVVRNRAGGPNVLDGAVYDYDIDELTPESLMGILQGQGVNGGPAVMSTRADNIFFFMVGHGGRLGAAMGASTPREATVVGGPEKVITPGLFADSWQAMADAGRFRRAFVAVEACHSGVLGADLTAPGVVLLTAANPFENSLAANYDREIRVWLADQFSYALLARMERAGSVDMALAALYREIYLSVSGSHAMIYNSVPFGDIGTVGLGEFLVTP